MSGGAGVPPALPERRLVVHASLCRPRPFDAFRARFMRSAGSRFALVYAGLFAASALAIALFIWWSTAGLIARQTDAAINADSLGLAERYAEGGTVALLETIDQRIAGNIDDDAIYLLAGPDYQHVAGNLERWPTRILMDQEWTELAINRGGLREQARVHYFDLIGGFHLLVGRDISNRMQMRRLLADALLWSAAIALVLGLAGAWTLRRVFATTLADISETATAISAGDLSRRLPRTGRGEEFDRLADIINDMLDRIARLMDGVRQVSNAIAHDLRTPIARARARLEYASTHAKGEEDLNLAIERALADLDGVTDVFQALLRIAEIEAGSRRSAFAPLDLAPLLDDLVELYAAAAEERGLVLHAGIAPSLRALGDREMLQQAVVNLLDNAIKFSPPGGTVTLTADAAGAEIVIALADQGPGIPEADRPRATERFFRGEQARQTPGSGLGLALVQAVASLHGGVLTLEDAAPGLRAVLSLPGLGPEDGAPAGGVAIGPLVAT